MKKIGLLLSILIVFGGVFYYNTYYFNADRILQNSILKDKKFNIEVKEVVSVDGKLKAYLMEDKSVPLVAFNFSFKKAGSAYEPRNGVALFTESLILDGAGKYDRKTLRRLMKEKGIKIGISSDKDCMRFSFSYVKEFEKDAIEVLKAVLYEPLLNKEDVDLVKTQIKALKKREKENPKNELMDLVRDEFYKNHAYGKDSTAQVV
jgi:zinc protease